MAELDFEESEACATERLVEVASGETVGLLYTWDDGVKQPYWFDGERSDVIAINLLEADCSRKNA